MVGIGAAHDHGERGQRGIVEVIALDERVERAARPMVAQLHVGHVIGNGMLTGGDGHHVGRRNEQKLWRGVDEARDEPGARRRRR